MNRQEFLSSLSRAAKAGIQFKEDLVLTELEIEEDRFYGIMGILPLKDTPAIEPVSWQFRKVDHIKGFERVKMDGKAGQIVTFKNGVTRGKDTGVLLGVEIGTKDEETWEINFDFDQNEYLVMSLEDIYTSDSTYEECSRKEVYQFSDSYLYQTSEPRFHIGQLVKSFHEHHPCEGIILGQKWSFQASILSIIENPEKTAQWEYMVYYWNFEENKLIDLVGYYPESELVPFSGQAHVPVVVDGNRFQ